AVAARLALAADRLEELVEIFLAVVVGDLLAGLDGPPGVDLDLAPDSVRLRVRLARMIDVARRIGARRALDRPSLVEVEPVLAPPVVAVVPAHQRAPVFDDELAGADRLGREQAEAGARAGDAERTTLMPRPCGLAFPDVLVGQNGYSRRADAGHL